MTPKTADSPADPDVGALEDLGATGPGVALGGEDHRLGRPVGLEPAPEDHLGLVLEALEPLVVDDPFTEPPDLGQVHPGAEGVALAGEDGDPDVVVGVEPHPGVVQTTQDLGVGCVLLLGSVDGDHENWAVGLHQHQRICHQKVLLDRVRGVGPSARPTTVGPYRPHRRGAARRHDRRAREPDHRRDADAAHPVTRTGHGRAVRRRGRTTTPTTPIPVTARVHGVPGTMAYALTWANPRSSASTGPFNAEPRDVDVHGPGVGRTRRLVLTAIPRDRWAGRRRWRTDPRAGRGRR